jgi:hypothetical protein
MRRTVAVTLALVGLVLAVGVPILLAVGADIDLGKKPGFLVGALMPGVAVIAFASRLWRTGGPAGPAPDQVPPGYRVCDLCRQPVLVADGADRRLDVQTPLARMAFVCSPCARYRTRRALLVLVLFLAGLGALALVVSLTLPRPNRKK